MASSQMLEYAVTLDLEPLQDQVRSNVRTLRKDVNLVLLRMDSTNYFSKEMFDLVYVDGDHSFEMALHDMKKCWNYVKPGGIMAIDDTIKDRRDGSNPQVFVYEAATEFLRVADSVDSYFLRYPSFGGFGIFCKGGRLP